MTSGEPTWRDVMNAETHDLLCRWWEWRQPREEALRDAEHRHVVNPGQPVPLRCRHDIAQWDCRDCA